MKLCPYTKIARGECSMCLGTTCRQCRQAPLQVCTHDYSGRHADPVPVAGDAVRVIYSKDNLPPQKGRVLRVYQGSLLIELEALDRQVWFTPCFSIMGETSYQDESLSENYMCKIERLSGDRDQPSLGA